MPRTDRPRGPRGEFLRAVPPTAAPAADEAAPILNQVLGVLEGLKAGLDALGDRQERLEAQVRETAARTPSFVPVQPPAAPRPPGPGAAARPLGPGESATGRMGKDIFRTVQGEPLTAGELARNPPRFGPGTPVKIDPDSARDGFAAGLTWGAVLARVGSDGVGRVLDVQWVNRRDEWKYRVAVPGMTPEHGDGFHDRELLPL